MPPIGWQEMLIVAAIALIVIGPQDLPKFARMVGNIASRIREMARDFQSSLQDIEHETEFAKIRNQVNEQLQDIKNYNPLEESQNSIADTFGQIDNLEPMPDKTDKPDAPKKVAGHAAPVGADDDGDLDPNDDPDPVISHTAARQKPAADSGGPSREPAAGQPAKPKAKTKAKTKTKAKPKAKPKAKTKTKTTAKKTATKTRAKAGAAGTAEV